VRSVTWSATPAGLVITVSARIAPPVLEWSVETTFTYTFTNQHVSIHVKGVPKGHNVPRTFARIGLEFGLNKITDTTWFGRGPGESYRDKKLSQAFGTYNLPVEKLWTPYEFPQESGNRTDVRWVSFSTSSSESSPSSSIKASFADQEGSSFQASHYATQDVEESKHPFELEKKKKEETLVRLDWAHHGLGTGSCGPATLKEYELLSEEFEYEVLLE
jgi:beta-galactosidase